LSKQLQGMQERLQGTPRTALGKIVGQLQGTQETLQGTQTGYRVHDTWSLPLDLARPNPRTTTGYAITVAGYARKDTGYAITTAGYAG